MQKINFQNLPSTSTPLNATNMNAIQTNIENIFNGTEPAGNMVVDSIRSKNLFNKDDVGVGFFSSNGAIQTNSNYRYSNYIDVSNINKITISGVTNTGTAHIIEYNSSHTFVDFWQSRNQTITLNANTKYVRVSMHHDDLNTYQVEKGSSATAYAPYQELNNKEHYSTEETKIGTWIDGKTLYRKVIDLGNFPNNSLKSVAHNCNNISFITNTYGIGYLSDTDVTTVTLPFIDKDGLQYSIQLRADKTNIGVITGSNRTSMKGYAIIEYTKTTD